MSHLYVGIDPGQSGGIAFLCPTNNDVMLYRMPANQKELNDLIKRMGMATVILEKAQPMPSQGSVSGFSYGVGYGVLIGMLVAHGIRFIEVRPAEWKKIVLAGVSGKGKSKKEKKDDSIVAVERLFPEVNLIPAGCKKPHDGIAEALLLAEYGRRLNL